MSGRSHRFAGPRVTTILDVTEKQLCTGCGVCAFEAPEALEMTDVLDHGRRPVLRPGHDAAETTDALGSCPGVELRHDPTPPGTMAELFDDWGPVIGVWEGYAADPEIRFAGSSGGAASALAIDAIENRGLHGLLHIGARADVPFLNQTIYSTTRDEILAATGSRYAPASPCDRLDLVESAPAPSVFIGKPCDVAAARASARRRPALAEKLGLTVAIFCAGTPTTRGTLEMAAAMGVADADSIRSVRYRGKGWPGNATISHTTASGQRVDELSYADSWGEILQKHRQWRCHVCIDHTGEFADVAVGDPWYREIEPGDPGRSLVVARTERGRLAVEAAIESGALDLDIVDPALLPASQPNLLATRGAVWGRIATSRLFFVAAPRYRNMPMFGAWRRLSTKAKAQSFYGTAKRLFRRRLFHRAEMEPIEDGAVALRTPQVTP